jgi:hypothetical protein
MNRRKNVHEIYIPLRSTILYDFSMGQILTEIQKQISCDHVYHVTQTLEAIGTYVRLTHFREEPGLVSQYGDYDTGWITKDCGFDSWQDIFLFAIASRPSLGSTRLLSMSTMASPGVNQTGGFSGGNQTGGFSGGKPDGWLLRG